MLFYWPVFECVQPRPFMHVCARGAVSPLKAVFAGGKGACSQIPRSLGVRCVVLRQFHLANFTSFPHPLQPPSGNLCKFCLPGSGLILLTLCLLTPDTLELQINTRYLLMCQWLKYSIAEHRTATGNRCNSGYALIQLPFLVRHNDKSPILLSYLIRYCCMI